MSTFKRGLKLIFRMVKISCATLLSILPFLLIGILLLWIFLPEFLNRTALPLLLPKTGFKNVSVRIQDIGFFSTGAGPVVIGERGKMPVRLENIRVQYSIPAIVSAWVKNEPIPLESVDLSGINLSGTLTDDGSFRLDMSEWDTVRKMILPDSSMTVKKESQKIKLPVAIRQVRMSNVELKLRYRGELYWASAELRAVSRDGDLSRTPELSGTVMVQEHALNFEMKYQGANRWHAEYRLTANLEEFKNFFPENITGRISGMCTVKGCAGILLNASGIVPGEFQATGMVSGLTLNLRRNGASIFSMKYNKDEMVNFNLKRFEKSGIEITADRIKTQNPVTSENRLSCSMLPDFNGAFKVNLGLETKISGVRALPGLKLDSGIFLETHITGLLRRDVGGTLYGYVVTRPLAQPRYDAIGLEFPDSFITGLRCDMSNGKPLVWNVDMLVPQLKITIDSMTAIIPNIAVEVNNRHNIKLSATAGLQASLPESVTAAAPRLHLDAELNPAGVLSGLFSVDSALIKHPLAKVKNIALKLPLSWPYDPLNPPSAGSIIIPSIEWDGKSIANVEAVLQQQDKTVSVNGYVVTPKIHNLKTDFDIQTGLFSYPGKADAFGAKIGLDIFPQTLPANTDLSELLPDLKGFKGGGTISANVNFPLFIPGETPRASVRMTEGTLSSKEMKLNISGVTMNVTAEKGLRGWRTEAGQFLKLDRLQMGSIDVADFASEFRMEENGDIQIEGISFDFCGGEVRSLAMRVTPGNNQYQILLHCNQLLLREFFRQANLGDVVGMEGDIRISGLIPVDISGKNIRLGEGYLYTAPGVKGKMKLIAGKEVFGALPADHPEAPKLELSQMALSDFNYDWVKLNLNMVHDSATDTHLMPDMYQIQLSLFGKPEKPLPFMISASTGNLVKMQNVSAGQGLFQDMQLDLNLKSDVKLLNIALGLSKFIEEVEKNVKNPFKKPRSAP